MGLIAHAQLLELGFTRWSIARLARSGYLHSVRRGVYGVGHRPQAPYAREMAAVLACRPHAYLSARSAAAVWGFLPPDPDGPVHVTVTGRNPGTRAGVVVHRTGRVEHATRHGIPITTPARTLIDLAAGLSPFALGLAFDEARVQGLIAPRALARALDEHPSCPGAAALRALTRDDRRAGHSKGHTERLMWALIRRSGLPTPERNVSFGRWSVDLLWRAQGVAVELDGYDFHNTRSAFERDHEKDHVLRAHDLDLLRFTWRQVHDHPEQTLVRVTTALARPRRAS